MQDIRQTLTNILDIANYTGDKEAYITDFLDLCLKEAKIDVLDALPEQQKEALEKELTPSAQVPDSAAILGKSVTDAQYQEAVSKVVTANLLKLLSSLEETLTPEQVAKIDQIISA